MSKYDKLVNALLNDSVDDSPVFKKKQIIDTGLELGYKMTDLYPLVDASRRVRHSYYTIENEVVAFRQNNDTFQPPENTPIETPVKNNANTAITCKDTLKSVEDFEEHKPYIPEKNKDFVGVGHYSFVKKIIRSEQFFPLYISGMSGNGKTQMVKQICAELNREFIRVQISPDTDESDLLGGFRLFNGETVWQDGPVTVAAKQGSVLLLDEIDRSSKSIISLNGILEGEPFLIKKTGELVVPAPGFQVIATANTKGRGSESGRHTFAIILDEAILERFPVSLDHEFPSKKEHLEKILGKFMKNHSNEDEDPKWVEKKNQFVSELIYWSVIIDESFTKEAIDDTISVRRLIHILRTFLIIKNPMQSIKYCINRFDEVSAEAMLDMYKKITKLEIEEDKETKETKETVENVPTQF